MLKCYLLLSDFEFLALVMIIVISLTHCYKTALHPLIV